MLIFLLASMIQSSGTQIPLSLQNVMFVHYINDTLQIGPVKKEVANIMHILVKCYRIEDKFSEDSRTWLIMYYLVIQGLEHARIILLR